MKIGIRSKNVLIGNEVKDACVIIENEKISDLFYPDSINDSEPENSFEIIDYGDLVIMPSLIDTHVHINEPGREEWEGFETVTKAAAAGGITMLVDMPLNSEPVTTDRKSLDQKINSATGKLYIDVGFYGGAVPENVSELSLLYRCGVLGFKSFMIDSGLEEFRHVTENDLENILKELDPAKDVPLLVHAETNCGFDEKKYLSDHSYSSFLNTRPREWENKAIEILIRLSKKYDRYIHIVHLSSSDALDMIRQAKSDGIKITVETCPHYLYFNSENIQDNDTRFKCTPPIRENENREKLWEAVEDGTIDLIVSDHSPCTDELKCMEDGNFKTAWGGISSIQLGLSAIWTEAFRRGLSLTEVSKLMSANPAKLIGMEKRKGKIEIGMDADIIVFDPERKFIVDCNKLYHKNKLTPYDGEELQGEVIATYLRGNKIYDNGNISDHPKGRVIFRKTT
ncbi:MAG TPA: allantoinase AllB [Ignavibacteria bacterium]|nr:allantoinase AllB [Ignavibacteria bacterium]